MFSCASALLNISIIMSTGSELNVCKYAVPLFKYITLRLYTTCSDTGSVSVPTLIADAVFNISVCLQCFSFV